MAATRRTVLALAVAALLAAGGALAHGGASGIVKERMDMMVAMAGAMKRTLAALRADVPLDRTAAVADIRMVADHSRDMLKLFPAGSGAKPSEARPAVWREWADFEALAEDSAVRAEALIRAIEFGEEKTALRRFAELGRSCSACHERFRASDKEAF
jgi:cytochrome c556